MIISKIISREEWLAVRHKIVMCDSCLKEIIPIGGFCKCGMSLVAVDRLVITEDMTPKYIYIRGKSGIGSEVELTENQIVERIKGKHEHWFSINGKKVCRYCTERFDIPVEAKFIN